MKFDVPFFCMKKLDKLNLLSQLNSAIKRCSENPPFQHQVRKPRARSITVVMKAFGLPTTTSTLRSALHHNSLAADEVAASYISSLPTVRFICMYQRTDRIYSNTKQHHTYHIPALLSCTPASPQRRVAIAWLFVFKL